MAAKKEVKPNLGQLADELYATRERRYELDRESSQLGKRETELKDIIISALMNDPGMTGVTGKACRVTLTQKLMPTVTDWEAFHKYIKRTGSFDLMQKRLSEAAVKERWDAKKIIPGVGSFNATSLSINKVK